MFSQKSKKSTSVTKMSGVALWFFLMSRLPHSLRSKCTRGLQRKASVAAWLSLMCWSRLKASYSEICWAAAACSPPLRRLPRLCPTVLTHLGTRPNALKGTKQPEPGLFFFSNTIRHPLLARANLTAATESCSANQGWAWLVLDRGREGGSDGARGES